MIEGLSIAMTTFNGAQHLAEQLESFRAQTRLPDQLVVCDDGSTDSTVAILEDFARSSPFTVEIVRNRVNLGHERNFGQAIDLCRGEIIFLADQDDAWYPEKIATVEDAFRENPAALLFVNDVLITDENLQPTGRTAAGQMRAAGLLGANAKNLTLGCATAFRAELRRLISPVPVLDYAHDCWIHEFAEIIGGRRVLPKVLQFYRRHGANASNWAFNGSARASPFVMMRPNAGKDLSPEYAKRCRALSLMLERLQALGRDRFKVLGANRPYDEVIEDLRHAIAALKRRAGIFRRGPFSRKAIAFQLLARGEYQYFLGWRSFLKDLIR